MHEKVVKQKTPYIVNSILFAFLAGPVLTYLQINTGIFNY